MWAWKYRAVLAESRAGDGLLIDGTEDDAFVQAAQTVAFQIDGHEPEPEAAECAIDGTGDLGIEQPGHLVAGHFDPGDLAVMPDAEDTESERADGFFRLLDDLELCLGHFREVGNAR